MKTMNTMKLLVVEGRAGQGRSRFMISKAVEALNTESADSVILVSDETPSTYLLESIVNHLDNVNTESNLVICTLDSSNNSDKLQEVITTKSSEGTVTLLLDIHNYTVCQDMLDFVVALPTSGNIKTTVSKQLPDNAGLIGLNVYPSEFIGRYNPKGV